MASYSAVPISDPKTILVIWRWNSIVNGQPPNDPIVSLHDTLPVCNKRDVLCRFDFLRNSTNLQDRFSPLEGHDYLVHEIIEKAESPLLVLAHDRDFAWDDYMNLMTFHNTHIRGGTIRIRHFGEANGPIYFKNCDLGLLGARGFALAKPSPIEGQRDVRSDVVSRDENKKAVSVNPRHFERLWHLYWHHINHFITKLSGALGNHAIQVPLVLPTTLRTVFEQNNLSSTLQNFQALADSNPDSEYGFTGYEAHFEGIEQFSAAECLRELRNVVAENLNLSIGTGSEFRQTIKNIANALVNLQEALPEEEKML